MPIAAGNPKILGQAKGTSTLTSIYTPGASIRAMVQEIFVANIVGGAADFQICIDERGSTYNDSNAIAWNVSCGDGIVVQYTFREGLWLSGSDSIGVFSQVTNDHTFTVFGKEIR